MLLEPPHDENRILDLPWEGSDTSFARIRFTALLCFTLPLVGLFAFTMFLNRFRCLFHFNPACVRAPSLVVVFCLYACHVSLKQVCVCVCEYVMLCFLRSASPAAQVTLRPHPAMPLAPLSPMSFLLLPVPASPVTVQTIWLCVPHPPTATCSRSSVCMFVAVASSWSVW